jgi:hypothetical protein
MELDQWIAIYGAISQSAASHSRSRWVSFTGGLLAVSLLVVFLAYLAQLGVGTVERAFGIGASSLGLLIGLAWWVNQGRLYAECRHWERLLRSVEEQFAGAEFFRSLHRMLQGEETCVPVAKWVCGEWHSEPARVPKVLKHLPSLLETWIPAVFVLTFVALLVWFILI